MSAKLAFLLPQNSQVRRTRETRKEKVQKLVLGGSRVQSRPFRGEGGRGVHGEGFQQTVERLVVMVSWDEEGGEGGRVDGG